MRGGEGMSQGNDFKGRYPPHIWYPPNQYPGNSPFATGKTGATSYSTPPLKPEQEFKGPTERSIAEADIWPLLPAAGGAGAEILLLLMANHKQQWNDENTEEISFPKPQDNPVGSAVIVIYSILATTGVSYYIFRVLTSTDGPMVTAFVPTSSAITLLIIYFTVAYDLEFHLVPGSFSGDHFGNDIVTELFTFFYFSATTFATASMGDITPVSSASRFLVTLEVLFFIFIFTMGIVFFAGHKRR